MQDPEFCCPACLELRKKSTMYSAWAAYFCDEECYASWKVKRALKKKVRGYAIP